MTEALRPAADFLSRRSVPDPQAPTVRPRRLRTTPAMRRLAREHVVDPAALILPVFVREDIDAPRPVEAMPGVVQHTLDSLRREAAACAEAGIGAIDLFGVPAARRLSKVLERLGLGGSGGLVRRSVQGALASDWEAARWFCVTNGDF